MSRSAVERLPCYFLCRKSEGTYGSLRPEAFAVVGPLLDVLGRVVE